MARAARQRRLVLHMDVNETILIGDPVSGLDFQASLNNVISKVAIVKPAVGGPVWHDGSPIDPALRSTAGLAADAPPPELRSDFRLPPGWEPYFQHFRGHEAWPPSKFTEPGMPGEIYRPVFERMQNLLRWSHDPDRELAPHGHHFLVPSFFHTLCELERSGRDFCLVVRTFGTDLPEIAAAITAFAEGRHPDFPSATGSFAELRLEAAEARWALRRTDRRDVASPISLCQHEANLGNQGYGRDLASFDCPPVSREVHGDEAILKLFADRRVIGIRDDYHVWRANCYRPVAAKPCWLMPDDDDALHIFFDDNIHDNPDDSIVGVRAHCPSTAAAAAADAGPFACLSGEAIRQLQGVTLVKARPLDAVLDKDYFLKQIERCEANYSRLRESGELQVLAAQLCDESAAAAAAAAAAGGPGPA